MGSLYLFLCSLVLIVIKVRFAAEDDRATFSATDGLGCQPVVHLTSDSFIPPIILFFRLGKGLGSVISDRMVRLNLTKECLLGPVGTLGDLRALIRQQRPRELMTAGVES